MKKIAMVPCRGGSKGIPKKNIYPFNGKPLLYWNIKALLDYGQAEVYLNTDDAEIEKTALEYFGNLITIFNRSERTAKDTATTVELVQEFVEKQDMDNEDILIISQVTSPYLQPEDVRKAVDIIEHGKEKDDFNMLAGKYGSIQSVGYTHKFIYDYCGVCINVKGPHKRRQDWEGTLQRNGCLYVTTAGMIRRTASYTGGNLGQILQPHVWEIDSMGDLLKGEWEIGNTVKE